jgi:hypothetical protein
MIDIVLFMLFEIDIIWLQQEHSVKQDKNASIFSDSDNHNIFLILLDTDYNFSFLLVYNLVSVHSGTWRNMDDTFLMNLGRNELHDFGHV